MLNVVLTGNIGSGKSTVARWFAEWGATVIDADRLVHDLQRPGTGVFRSIVDRFGPRVVAAGGSLDRAALRAIVFADPAERAALEAIVHPGVAAERARLVEAARRRGDRIVVSDIPLLFETGDPGGFDAVVLVDARPDIRLERLMATRGLDRPVAEAMIAAQAPAEAKRAKSTFVIDNDADLGALERRSKEVWAALETMTESGRDRSPRAPRST